MPGELNPHQIVDLSFLEISSRPDLNHRWQLGMSLVRQTDPQHEFFALRSDSNQIVHDLEIVRPIDTGDHRKIVIPFLIPQITSQLDQSVRRDYQSLIGGFDHRARQDLAERNTGCCGRGLRFHIAHAVSSLKTKCLIS